MFRILMIRPCIIRKLELLMFSLNRLKDVLNDLLLRTVTIDEVTIFTTFMMHVVSQE